MKNLIVFCFGLMLIWNANAAELTPLDSIGIEKVGDKTFIIHQVDQGETLFGISRRYQVAISDILQSNEQLQDGLKMGQRIRVPYITKAAIPEGSQLHKVAQGETLFSISRQYGVTVGDIMKWNNLQGNDLSVGQALVIQKAAAAPVVEKKEEVAKPVQQPVAAATEKVEEAKKKAETEKPVAKAREEDKAVSAPAVSTPSASASGSVNTSGLPGDWITHTVAQGETLFAIAQKYDAKVEDLIKWNALSSNNLSLGQNLKVGREKADAEKVPVVTASVPVVINNERTEGRLTTSNPEVSTDNSNTAYKNIKETGLAEVIEGTGNHKKYLVLHRNAPVGTIMRVRNEENDITIFARVVGKLPETGDNSRLVIKLSKAAFDQLRAVNARFPVEISY
ncbi:LysM peptidoglycan-binding domain-containing protein [Fontibacter flavus]|uniref:LysM peptidoglycan-binding domain-containing protein n=1 Tax=Fontibacter flavus TaxID=654838 RepID=A0ABV6FTX3_9BACT